MKRHPVVLLGSSLFVAVAVLAGCAAEPNAISRSSVLTQQSVSSRDAGNLAFVYRRQAKILRDVASRLKSRRPCTSSNWEQIMNGPERVA